MAFMGIIDDLYEDGFDPESEGSVWAFGDLGDASDVQLAKVQAFVNRFPKAGANQAVKASAMRAALYPLMPLARKVAGLKDGSSKRSLVSSIFGPGGQGYLTGPNVTSDDKVVSNRIIFEVEQRLPALGEGPVPPDLYNQIKQTAHRLLMIGHDLGDDVSVVIEAVWRAFESVGQAVIEVPQTVMDTARDLAQRMEEGGEALREVICKSPAGTFMWSCWSTPVKVAVVTGGVLITGLLLYGVYKIVLAATPTATEIVAKRYGLRGVPGRRRRRARRRAKR